MKLNHLQLIGLRIVHQKTLNIEPLFFYKHIECL